MNDKPLFTREQFDHAIDYALKIGAGTLSELYGRKDYIEQEMKRINKEYEDVMILIDKLETERNNYAKPTEESGD